ncbi:hypothetical protein VP01_10g6 [Puccinia sorghi]|uniref:AB hydrolase-1 domain-containing protein n=1 Tax=Puccinia sorghi TaxID=27349 RepID=A0A0L6VT41_9BASI|nr:hypothetical protein VP01_10g6 [Puccinia sorghi]
MIVRRLLNCLKQDQPQLQFAPDETVLPVLVPQLGEEREETAVGRAGHKLHSAAQPKPKPQTPNTIPKPYPPPDTSLSQPSTSNSKPVLKLRLRGCSQVPLDRSGHSAKISAGQIARGPDIPAFSGWATLCTYSRCASKHEMNVRYLSAVARRKGARLEPETQHLCLRLEYGKTAELPTLSTILDPETCAQKGLCPVATGRARKPRQLYYEIHGDLKATQKMVLSHHGYGIACTQKKKDSSLRRELCSHGLISNLHSKLVLGLNFTCSAWSGQVRHFGRKPDHAVLVFDNRGVGNSELSIIPSRDSRVQISFVFFFFFSFFFFLFFFLEVFFPIDNSLVASRVYVIVTNSCGTLGLYKTSEMAMDVLDLLEFLKWDQERSIHVFGVSLGGMISQELSLLIPSRIKSMTFISTRCGDKLDMPSVCANFSFIGSGSLQSGKGGRTDFLSSLVSMRAVRYEEGLDMMIDFLFPEAYLKQPTSEGQTEKDELREFFKTWHNVPRRQSPAGAVGQVCAALGHHCSGSNLARISRDLCPGKIAVILGERDEVIFSVRSLELHDRLPGSELVVFKDGGHALSCQFSQQFNTLMERIMMEGNQAFSTEKSAPP